ncbi:hypothetical protein [Sphingomonas sp. R86521]|uniref:hypothetical protein n=1 Tax=Sphingomonas sp. R86521 TaxID=3093860 RepID=UPI0036D228B1
MKRFSTRLALAGSLGLGLAGCAVPAARPAVGTAVIPFTSVGLERVLGQDAAGLIRLFGQPDADVREGGARKLQFESGICVLDAYLYPKGSDAPKVTYVDAREPDGSTIDRASCVAALTRRDGGR